MVGVVAAFLIALVWSILSIWIGPRVGLVDSPNASALKVHVRPTPLIGGVGVYGGIHAGLLIEGEFDPVLFVATTAVLVLGLVDDAFMLSAKLRLGVELAASTFLVVLIDSGNGSIMWTIGAVVLVLVAVNAVNLVDGLDGLVASTAFVSGLGLAWAGSIGLGGQALGFVIAAALAGFGIMNWQPARVFLGDNGAYVIGMVLAYGALEAGSGDVRTTLFLVVGTLGVYLIDLVATIARRAHRGSGLFEGDRSHLYDWLRDRGWSVHSVALFAAAVQLALVVASISLVQ